MDLVSGLSAASKAIEIVRELRKIDRDVDEASFKLKIADLAEALADTKLALAEARQDIAMLTEKLSSAEGGDLCPICKDGRLKVVKFTKHDVTAGIEFHVSQCSNSLCGYETERLFDSGLGQYDTARVRK